MAPREGGSGEDVGRLSDVIKAQTEATKENTKAFMELKSDLDKLNSSMKDVHDDLTNGPFVRLQKNVCEAVRQGDEVVVAEIGRVTAEQTTVIKSAIEGTRGSVNIPKLGWVAIVLFFLVMLVAFGVKIPELVAFFK